MRAAKTTTRKKTTARKPAARRTAPKKAAPAAKRPKRKYQPKPVKPMSEAVRVFASKVMAAAAEAALSSEQLGVSRQSTTELRGARSGVVNRITLDDGTRLIVQVYASSHVNKRRKKGAEEDSEEG